MPIRKIYAPIAQIPEATHNANLMLLGQDAVKEYLKTGKTLDDLASYFNGSESMRNAVQDIKKLMELGETVNNNTKAEEQKKEAYFRYLDLLDKFANPAQNANGHMQTVEDYMKNQSLDDINTPEVAAVFAMIHVLNQQAANFKLLSKRIELDLFLKEKNAIIDDNEKQLKNEIEELTKDIINQPKFYEDYEKDNIGINNEIAEAEKLKSDENIEKVYNDKIAVFDTVFDDPKVSDSTEMKAREQELKKSREDLTLEFNQKNEEIKNRWAVFNEQLQNYNKEIEEVAAKNENIRIQTEAHTNKVNELEANIEKLGRDAEPIKKEIGEMELNVQKMDKAFESYIRTFNEYDGLKRKASLDQPNEEDLETVTTYEETKDLIYNQFYGAIVKEFPDGDPENVLYDALHIKDQKKFEEENRKLQTKINENRASLLKKKKQPEEDATYKKLTNQYRHNAQALSIRSLIDTYKMGETAEHIINTVAPLLKVDSKVNVFKQLTDNLDAAQQLANKAKERNPHFWNAKRLEGEFIKFTPEKMNEMKTKMDDYQKLLDEKINSLKAVNASKEKIQNELLKENERFAGLNLGEEDKGVRIPPVPPMEKPMEGKVLEDRILKAANEIMAKYAPRIQTEKDNRHKDIKAQVKNDLEAESNRKKSLLENKLADRNKLKERVEAIFNHAKTNADFTLEALQGATEEAEKPASEMITTMKEQLDYFKEHIMDVFKDGHKNTKEFVAMAGALNAASIVVDELNDQLTGEDPKADRKKINGAKEALQEKFNDLSTKCGKYLEEKKGGIHWLPSKMRFFRIDMANAMKNFAQNAGQCLEKDTMFITLPGGQYVQKLTAKPLLPKGINVKEFYGALTRAGALKEQMDFEKITQKVFSQKLNDPQKEDIQINNLTSSTMVKGK